MNNTSSFPSFTVSLLVAGSLIVLGLMIYFPALTGPFMYDDIPFIAENDAIKDLSAWPQYFSSTATLAKESHHIWRPLRTLSFAGDYALWQLNPLGYHLTNLFFHCVNSFLVFLLCRVFCRRYYTCAISDRIAGGTALLFLTHPVQVEAVTWISSRGDVLYVFFILLAFLTYIRHVHYRYPRIYYYASLLLYSAALLSKETAIMFVVVLGAYEGLIRKQSLGAVSIRLGPFLLLGALWFGVRLSLLGHMAQRAWWGGSVYATLLTVFTVIPHYAGLLIMPHALRLEYHVPVMRHIMHPAVMGSALALVLLILIMLIYRRRYPLMVFSLCWIGLWLVPVLQIVPMISLVQERFLYGSVMGYVLLFALGSMRCALRSKRHWTVWYALIIMIVIGIYGGSALRYNTLWRDPLRLWEHTARLTPESVRAQANLGNWYFKRARFDKACLAYEKALTLNPDQPAVYTALGLTYTRLGEYAKAHTAYDAALALDEAYALGYLNRGMLFIKQERFEEARSDFKRACAFQPDCQAARYNLALLDAWEKQ